jgi:hypothetical protein
MKKAALLTAALLAAALFWTVPAVAGPIPASAVPNGARWIAHLDMEKFVHTDLYGYLEKSGAFEIKDRDVDKWLKIDIPKDVTGVTIFGLGDGTKDNAVILVAGRFDKPALLARIAQEPEHKEIPYGGTTIYSAGSDEFGAFVNDHLIALSGSQAGIEKALDTAASKGKNFVGSELSDALKGVPADAFLSGVMPELGKLGRGLGNSKVLDQASGLFFLAQETKGVLMIRVQLVADTAENAKNIADIAQGLIAMGRMSGGNDRMSQAMALLDGLQVRQDGKTIKLSFERPSKEIADLIIEKHGVKGLLD